MRSTIIVLCLALLATMPAADQPEPFYGQMTHAPAGILGQPFPVTFSLSANGPEHVHFDGEIIGDDHDLILSGSWDLILDEMLDNHVIASRSLKPPAQGQGVALVLTGQPAVAQNWIWNAQALFTHPGNYQFHLRYKSFTRDDEPFRIDTTLDPPPWITVAVHPDHQRAMLGEPVRVDLEVKNTGIDSYHVRFGGDYRGASRALRFFFTAERQDGAQGWDPEPLQMCFGGIGPAGDLTPGKSEHQTVTLGAYVRFPGPGTYSVTMYHALEFGTLVAIPGHPDLDQRYARAGIFTLVIDPPSVAVTDRILRVATAAGVSEYDRWNLLAHLHEPFFLAPLREALSRTTDAVTAVDLVDGIDSIETIAASAALIDQIGDARPAVQTRALLRLRGRMPDPRRDRLTGRTLAEQAERRLRAEHVANTWNDDLRQRLLEALAPALASADPDAFGNAVDILGLAAGDGSAEALARASDHFAPMLPIATTAFTALNHIENAGYVLGQAHQPLCLADQTSSPGRLICWASMLLGSDQPPTAASDALLVHMLSMPCLVIRHAAIRALSLHSAEHLPIPWQDLFQEEDWGIWHEALTKSRSAPPAIIRAAIRACPRTGWSADRCQAFDRVLQDLPEEEKPPIR